MTPSEASRNGRRTEAGTLGRCGVSRALPLRVTGSGMNSAPTNAIASSTSRTT